MSTWCVGRPAPRTRQYRCSVLRFLTAGESHGQALVVIVEGLPAGLAVTVEDIQAELARRRLGYGRGPRQRFESRRADAARRRPPRPHARLAGGHRDQEHRVVPQRQVARRDVAGARGDERAAHPGAARARRPRRACRSTGSPTPATCSSGRAPGRPRPASPPAPWPSCSSPSSASTSSPTSCRWARPRSSRGAAPDAGRPRPGRRVARCAASTRPPSEAMIAEIKAAAKDGDSLGGVVEVLAYGVPGRARQPRPLGPQARRAARRRR